ncbi:MAG TPA: hypothetical protein PLT34_03165 [Muribaculaceae bacterium]|nr:hypothetical protein [Muribaculaceae bacterium]
MRSLHRNSMQTSLSLADSNSCIRLRRLRSGKRENASMESLADFFMGQPV